MVASRSRRSSRRTHPKQRCSSSPSQAATTTSSTSSACCTAIRAQPPTSPRFRPADRAVGAAPTTCCPLNTYLTSTASWSLLPGGRSRARARSPARSTPSTRVRTTARCCYNKSDLRTRPGSALPWQPKSWHDIITAARRSRPRSRGVTPHLAQRRHGLRCERRALHGINNFLVGCQDADHLRQEVQQVRRRQPRASVATLALYSQAYADRGSGADYLGAVQPQRGDNPADARSSQRQAGHRRRRPTSYGGNWTKFISFPYWPQTRRRSWAWPTIPTSTDGGAIRITLGGLGLRHLVSQHRSAQAAFDFINVAEEPAEHASTPRTGPAGYRPSQAYWNLACRTPASRRPSTRRSSRRSCRRRR